MTYEDAHDLIAAVKRFCRQQIEIQDMRSKGKDLVVKQLDSAYRQCCVVDNHIRIAQKYATRKNVRKS